MQPELLVSWVSRLGLVELSHTWLLRGDVHHRPRLFQPRGQCLSPRCHLPAQAVLPHPGVCCRPGDVFWPPLSQSRAGPAPLLLGFRHSRAGRGRVVGHQQRAGAAPSSAQHSPGRHCQPDLTPCPGSQLRPLFLLALADFLAAAVLLSTATIQLLPAPLFIPAYAACPYGLMLATVSGAARTMTGANGTSAPPPVLLGTEQDPSVGDPSVGWSIPGEVPCGEALLLPRAVSSSPLSVPSHHGGFLGEAQPAAPGRSALQPHHFPLVIPMTFLQPGVANPAQPCLVGTHGDRSRRGSAPWGQL